MINDQRRYVTDLEQSMKRYEDRLVQLEQWRTRTQLKIRELNIERGMTYVASTSSIQRSKL